MLMPIGLGFLPTMGGYEWLIILLIILILFGAKKLPELARGLGEAIREFRRASQGEVSERALSSMSEDKVIKLAKELGIDVEGKSKEEIVKQIIDEVSKSRAK